jgi:hypothetical protein
MTEQILTYTIGSKTLRQRVSDGRYDLTSLCRQHGKVPWDWMDTNKTRQFLDKCKKEQGVDAIVTKQKTGTWGNFNAVLHVAQWISADFFYEMTEWVREWVHHRSENLERMHWEICKMEATLDAEVQSEKDIRDKVAAVEAGQTEVWTPVGYIDVLTHMYIIEIKRCKHWKHALGQLLCYNKAWTEMNPTLPAKILRMHLFEHEQVPQDIKINIAKYAASMCVIVTWDSPAQ